MAISSLLEELNADLAGLVEQVRSALVQVRNRGGGNGAGTILHQDGLVLTNAHVVQGPAISVVLPGGRRVAAKVLAIDEALDLAALEIEADHLPVMELGDSNALQAGQWVLALGHPWGVQDAATAGVVLGAGPDWPRFHRRRGEYIAVSLPLRPGNSGGPLVNAYGQLVGVNTMMIGPEVGLSVPSHVAKAFLHERVASRMAAVA